MKRAAVYVRVSTEKKEQEKSLQNQKDFFYDYIEKNNLELVDFYVDIETATKDDNSRSDFNRLLKDAKDNKFDVILSKELSRLARNGKVAYELKTLLLNNSINLVTFDNAIDTTKGETKNFGLYVWLYEQESERISERTKYSLRVRAQKGLFKGSKPPYGYYVDKGKLFIKDDHSPSIVKRIFSEYISGKGFDSIAKGLFHDNIPTPNNSSCKWCGSSVRKIIENYHYTGDLVQGRTTTISVSTKKRRNLNEDEFIVVENCHDAIISKSDFKIAQELIKQRRKKRPSTQSHIFSNILVCSDCKKGMHYKKNRNGYICGQYNKLGIKACSSHKVDEDELYKIILNDINSILKTINTDSLISVMKAQIKSKISQQKNEILGLNNEISKLISSKNLALDKLIHDVISKDEYNAYIKDLDIKINILNKNKIKCESFINNNNFDDMIKEIDFFKNLGSYIDTLTPNLINRLISKIEIKEDGSPIIYYRFSWASKLN